MKEPERTITIKLYKEALPDSIHSFVREESPDVYWIVTRSQDSPDWQETAFTHECLHIYRNDLHSVLPADELEKALHNEAVDTFRELYPDATGSEIQTFKSLVQLASDKGLRVVFLPLVKCYGMLYGDLIALKDSERTAEETCFTLAHELAHSVLHTNKNLIKAPDSEAEEQASAVAELLLDLCQVGKEI